ncbi:Metal homeostatis protein BSD2 [Rhodotorula toruloides]|nr:Metal homeostatis protein BSD2 [Rhodotorula toruloides]
MVLVVNQRFRLSSSHTPVNALVGMAALFRLGQQHSLDRASYSSPAAHPDFDAFDAPSDDEDGDTGSHSLVRPGGSSGGTQQSHEGYSFDQPYSTDPLSSSSATPPAASASASSPRRSFSQTHSLPGGYDFEPQSEPLRPGNGAPAGVAGGAPSIPLRTRPSVMRGDYSQSDGEDWPGRGYGQSEAGNGASAGQAGSVGGWRGLVARLRGQTSGSNDASNAAGESHGLLFSQDESDETDTDAPAASRPSTYPPPHAQTRNPLLPLPVRPPQFAPPSASGATAGRVFGGGQSNDGVFANLAAKPDNPQGLDVVGEGPDKNEVLPPYEAAQLDPSPAYWETTVITPGGPFSADDICVDGLPVGNLFSFAWNLLVSMSFQFVGFLLTYILHTTHAAKNGSRAGLGITLIQLGFYIKQRTDHASDFPLDPSSPGDETGLNGSAGPSDLDSQRWTWWGGFDDTPVESATATASGVFGSLPTQVTDALGNVLDASDPQATPTGLGMPSLQGDGLSVEEMGRMNEAANEWFAFALVTVGSFLLIGSCLAYWRAVRYARAMRRGQGPGADAENMYLPVFLLSPVHCHRAGLCHYSLLHSTTRLTRRRRSLRRPSSELARVRLEPVRAAYLPNIPAHTRSAPVTLCPLALRLILATRLHALLFGTPLRPLSPLSHPLRPLERLRTAQLDSCHDCAANEPSSGTDAPSSAISTSNPSTTPSTRSRPPLSLAFASSSRAPTPTASDELPPQSPAVVLSPSTPDFPTVGLPAEPTELVPAQVLPPGRMSGIEEMLGENGEADDVVEDLNYVGERRREQKGRVDPALRDSLALLDSRMAEIESFGFNGVGRALTEEDRTIRLPAITTNRLTADASMNSLASISTNASSEDAFDIAEFPSIGDINSSFDLADLADNQRKRSSDLMAFPFPPALAQQQSSYDEANTSDELMFQRLAQLGQRGSIQGLGLFSSAGTDDFVSPVLSQQSSRSRSSTISDSSTLSSKSFDASSSTLASSAANTSSGMHDKGAESQEAFPAELTSTIPWFAQSPPNAISRSLPAPIDPLLANMGSAHPALASPFAPSVSPTTRYATRSSSLPRGKSPVTSRAPSRLDSLSVENLTAALDETGTAEWAPSSSQIVMTAEEFVQSPVDEMEILKDELPEPPMSAPIVRSTTPASPSTTGFKTLKRFSSLGLLRKKKCEAVLRDSTAANTNGASAKRESGPRLVKRKSEAALASLLRSRSGGEKDKENVPAMPTISRPVLQPVQAQNAKLPKRSASSPRLSKLFGASTTDNSAPAVPAKDEGTSRLKKRLSTYFNQPRGGPGHPPVPVAKSSTPTKSRPPAVDVAKANAGLGLARLATIESAQASPVPTLEPSTPSSVPPSSIFSEALPPSTSSPLYSSFAASSVSSLPIASRYVLDKPLPQPMPTSCFSAPPTQTQFPFLVPPSPASSAHSSAETADRPVSLMGFIDVPLRSTSIFPPTKLARERLVAPADSRSTRSPSPGGADSRPTSPSIADVLNAQPLSHQQLMAPIAPEEIIAFPVHLSAPHAATTSPSTGSEMSDDDYGSDSVTSDEDDDQPLGANPAALTAQKSLRLTAAKKSRGERKAREAKELEAKQQARQATALLKAAAKPEDPFELEKTAAMVASQKNRPTAATQPLQMRPSLSPVHSGSSVATLQSAGHDSLLPQTDASILRKAGSFGMTRSPSSPLDPMVADSSLTIDSPELVQQPLPRPKRSDSRLATERQRSKSPATTQSPAMPAIETLAVTAPPLRSPTLVSPSPVPSFRPPPVPSTSALPSSTSAFDRRPSVHRKASDSPSSSPAGTPVLGRRPSLHPDSQVPTMKRKVSESSTTSASPALSRASTLAGRSRSATVSSAPPVEHRIYLDASFAKYLKVAISDKTLAGEVVSLGKAKGALSKTTATDASEGGWALWESWRSTGLERPIREYELVSDVLKSWDQESNALLFRRTTMWPVLSAHARIHPPVPKSGQIQLEVKKGKWSKRTLELKDGTITYSKSEKGKDSTILCQLASFNVFLVSSQAAERLKAPKPYVFALKSRLTRAHFEEASEWCHFLSTKTPEEAASWVKTILEAGNTFARQREQAVLGTVSGISTSSSPSSSAPLLANAVPSSSPPLSASANSQGGALSRNPSSRPAPPILSQRSNTLPIPSADPSLAQQALQRNKSVVKPDSRKWANMADDERQEWLKTTEKAAKQTKTPLVDLSRAPRLVNTHRCNVIQMLQVAVLDVCGRAHTSSSPPVHRAPLARFTRSSALPRSSPLLKLDVVLPPKVLVPMDESLEGLQLPLFSGSWATDWATHEARRVACCCCLRSVVASLTLRNWLSVRGVPLYSREAAETLALSLTHQAAAEFEREAGPIERRVFEEGAAWCRTRWGDEQRTKCAFQRFSLLDEFADFDTPRLAMASALNKLTTRSFRERGRRREMVQDLVDDLERLFLQGKIVEDEAKRRAFVGCFLEFPGLVKRLAKKESFLSAVGEALVWEGEMVLKERRVRTESMNMVLGAGWAAATSRGEGEGARAADNAANRPVQDPDLRSSPSHLRPYASSSPDAPQGHPDPLNNPSFPYATPRSTFSRAHTRSVSASPFLAPETPSPTTRIPTPPFVAEATSTPRPSTSASSIQPAEVDGRVEEADFASFSAVPYPARPSPTSFVSPRRTVERAAAAREGRRSSSGLWLSSGETKPSAEPAGLGQAPAPSSGETLPRPASSMASYTADKTSTFGRGSGLIGFLRRGLGGHRRSKSYSGGPTVLASSGEGTAVEQASEGRPAKQRGKVVLGGLGLPP